MSDLAMEPLEVFTVESEDREGAAKYREVISDILSDLNLVRAIGRLKVYIDPKAPVFIIVGLFRPGLAKLTLGDVADITSVEEGLLVSIREELYASKAVGKLWAKYGRESVIQTERAAVIVPLKGDFAKQMDDISSIVVYDPREDLKKNVIDALLRITPEGFRVRKHYIDEHTLAFIASEDPIKPEWVEMCKKLRGSIGA
ncbi:putative methanogenesis marker protein 17 [Methanocella conradii HZ254]|uniref:Methanogenesis marker protein 17 n=1 Tax=Methanocella conradii (strain DSM 24694 / JCM 17849 / CGMCC 1.5162 / HZ254) TaxID=1041930 RepID=H8IAT6_METCZ|nr:methanogenesis marker 17 protein [Methanocella conradii]AFD00591.1 putative methanogenesis marker protein 17 [Methanocella conradii HZ254]MDI6896288.1 methanogenesis marker 17 protein [Methanocella conradii]